MFQHLMKENLTYRVVMEDIKPDVFGVFLHFSIYTSLVSLSEMVAFTVGLYTDADAGINSNPRAKITVSAVSCPGYTRILIKSD